MCIQASRTTGALFMEARPGKCPTAAQLRRVREATQQQLGLNLDPMLVMRKGALPKTTSGKVRRRECRHRFFNGTLGTPVAVEGVVPGLGHPCLQWLRRPAASRLQRPWLRRL